MSGTKRLLLLSVCAGLFCGSASAKGETLTPSPVLGAPADQPASDYAPSYNGQDFTRPQNSVATRVEYRTTSGTTSETERERLMLQLNSKFDLGESWKFAFQGQVPFVFKETTTFDPPGSTSASGFSETTAQVALIKSIDKNWAFGFGARLVAPTGEALGGGKWQIMPALGVRYSFLDVGPDTYFVPVVRYTVSFAGDPASRNISEPQIAPTLNIGLPDRWFVTFYPSNDIRINFGDPVSGQTGRLFLPFDAAIGRKFTDTVTMSLEASVPIVKDYPVYNFKTEFKVTVQF